MCLKNAIFMFECSEDKRLVKNWSTTYLGDDEAKELVIICDHSHFSCEDKWTKD